MAKLAFFKKKEKNKKRSLVDNPNLRLESNLPTVHWEEFPLPKIWNNFGHHS
jgi:hypothetical protein